MAETESVSDETSSNRGLTVGAQSYSGVICDVNSDVCLCLRNCSIKNVIDRVTCKFKTFGGRHGEMLRASKLKIGFVVSSEFHH